MPSFELIRDRASKVSFTDPSKFTRAQKFIEQNKKKLEDSSVFFNPDTTFIPVEDFHEANLRVLIVFGSPASVKAVSSTAAALNSFVKEICNQPRTKEQNTIPQVPHARQVPEGNARESLKVFMDFTYVPNGSDMKVFDKNNMPYAIGNITHLDASYFDVVGFSISVLSEVITCPNIIKSFSRCDSPIPLTWSERKGEVLGRYPLIYAGGITAACSDIMFGDLGDGRQAFVDYLYLGSCEKMDIMWERHIEALVHNAEIQALAVKDGEEVPPMPSIYNHNGVDIQGPISNQDYINSIFDMPMVYQPQAYKVVFDNRNRVIENTKINEYAQDFVKPYYPLEIDEDCLGIGMTVIQASGDNVGTSQIQVSEGCSAAGACSFCAEGNYTSGWSEKSRDRILWEARESKKYSAGYKMKPFSFNALPVDTYVACGEGRFTQFGDIENLKTVLTCEGEKSTIAGFLKDTKDRYFRFKLSRGMDARMSLKHKQMVLTEDGLVWKEADELKVGDWIPQNIGYYSEYLKDYQFSEMDYFLGLWFGDGCRQQPEWRKSIQCLNINEKELVLRCSGSNAFEVMSLRIEQSNYKWVYSDEYTEYFKTIFPNYKYGENNLHVLNISQLLSFIKGWFDADGDSSLSKNNVGKTDVGSRFKVTFAEKSMNVARLVGAVLNSIGINFHLSPTIEVKLDGYAKVHKRRDLTITGLKSRQLFLKYIGFTQSVKLEKIRDSKTIWSDKDKTLPGLFGKYLYSELKKLGKTKGFNTSKFFNGIKGITEDRFEEKFSNIDCEPVRLFNKGIRFSQIEKIEVVDDTIECADINEPKTNQFITEFGITHNCNYVTDYKGLLWEFMKIYPKVTFINMRMEELGRDVDALRMMKLVGSNRISAPMEGISPRIQNNLLNKCLSEESLTNFMDDMVHARLTDIKVGGIFTGYEEDEDFQWICDFVDRYKQRAAMENGNFPFRLKVTPLVHYNLTPIEYIERKSAKKSYEGEHWLSDEWYEKFREHNVFFKVNGFRYSTFIEQSIIDLGRSATKWMYDNIVSQNLPVYSLRSFATEEIVNNLKKIVNKDWFFEARNPEHYISISHRIHIDLMGSYIPRARRLVRLYEQGKILENPMDIRCLKTFEGAQTKCYSACVSKDPLKIYKDVKLDENDNLIGEFRELKGCERCPDKKHKMDRLARPTPQTKNSEDIISLPKLKPIQKVRFVLKRTDEYCVLNPNNTAHTFVAKFLQESEELVDMYYGVGGHNFFWQSDADIPYEVSGFQVVDVLFTSSKAFSIIDSLADKVSKSLKSVKIISYKKEFVEDQIKVNDYNVFRFETTLPYDLFQSACVSYKGDIRVKKDVLLETITDKSLKKPAFISIGKTVGYFVLPCKYNPYLYIQGLLMDKRIPLTKLRQEMNIENVLIVRDSMNICNCGKEKGFVSMVTGKQMKFGLNCLPAALLKVELNRKK